MAPSATSINVTTSVTSETADPDASNNTAASNPSINASADVALAVNYNGAVFLVTVTNHGPSDANGGALTTDSGECASAPCPSLNASVTSTTPDPVPDNGNATSAAEIPTLSTSLLCASPAWSASPRC